MEVKGITTFEIEGSEHLDKKYLGYLNSTDDELDRVKEKLKDSLIKELLERKFFETEVYGDKENGYTVYVNLKIVLED